MTGANIRGSLQAAGETGVMRIDARFDAAVDRVWSALTEPAQLDAWLGTVDGDLRQDGTLRASWHASGWEGTLLIEACEPPTRLVVETTSSQEREGVTEVTLADDGAHTLATFVVHGLPLDNAAAFGAGNQIHVEDLAAYLAGNGRCDARTRWEELHPGWEELASGMVDPG